jgi:hypothetical protein
MNITLIYYRTLSISHESQQERIELVDIDSTSEFETATDDIAEALAAAKTIEFLTDDYCVGHFSLSAIHSLLDFIEANAYGLALIKDVGYYSYETMHENYIGEYDSFSDYLRFHTNYYDDLPERYHHDFDFEHHAGRLDNTDYYVIENDNKKVFVFHNC